MKKIQNTVFMVIVLLFAVTAIAFADMQEERKGFISNVLSGIMLLSDFHLSKEVKKLRHGPVKWWRSF